MFHCTKGRFNTLNIPYFLISYEVLTGLLILYDTHVKEEYAIHTRPTDAPSSYQLSIPEWKIFSSFLRYSTFRGALSRRFMEIQLHNVSVSCMALHVLQYINVIGVLLSISFY